MWGGWIWEEGKEGGICIVNAVSAQFHCEAGASGTAFTFYFVAKIFDALHPRRIG